MAVSEAQKRATAKYEKENYDKILVRFPKGTKERISKVTNDSINSYIISNVLSKLDNDEGNNALQAENSQEKEQQGEFTDRLNKEALEALFKQYGYMKEHTQQLEILLEYGENIFNQYKEYLGTLPTE